MAIVRPDYMSSHLNPRGKDVFQRLAVSQRVTKISAIHANRMFVPPSPHKLSPFVPTLNHMNPVHVVPSSSLKAHFSATISPTHISSRISLSFSLETSTPHGDDFSIHAAALSLGKSSRYPFHRRLH